MADNVKFGRSYELHIQNAAGLEITIKPPFTIEFDVIRTTLTSSNLAKIRIYNLAENTRNFIRKDQYDTSTFSSMLLRAGYGDNLANIFVGSITHAWSGREGINFVTNIECFDGGFALGNGVSKKNFVKGTPLRAVILSLMADLPHITVKEENVGLYPGILTRDLTVDGNTAAWLSELTGEGFFIDNGNAFALGTTEILPSVGGTKIITSQSGLLGSPVLEQYTVYFDMLFEPSLNLGNAVQIISSTNTNFSNTIYKITSIKHRGIISESVAGTVITTAEFLDIKAKQNFLGLQ